MKYTGSKYELELNPDEDSESPREWDNLGTMTCWHSRYNLGDENEITDSGSWRLLHPAADYIVLPLYLYDHSGLHIKIGSFQGLLPQGHAEFDSMQIGYISVSKAKVRDEYGVKRITAKVRKRMESYLADEVEAYNQYINGDVWCYELTDRATGDLVDCCGGFYGDDLKESGIWDNLPADAQTDLEGVSVTY